MTDLLIYEPSVHLVAHTILDDCGIKGAFPDTELDGVRPIDKIYTDAWYMTHAGNAHEAVDTLPEFAGRFCYRSFRKGRPPAEFFDNILSSGHGSVLEHSSVSFAVAGVSRALSHELIRHRAGTAISQESQRYVDANDVRFVVPPALIGGDLTAFRTSCEASLAAYAALQAGLAGQPRKRVNEAARSVLPNAAETRFVWTMNLRAARHVCELRGSIHADLEIRRLAVVLARHLKGIAPLIFADFEVFTDEDSRESTRCKYSKV